MALNPIQNIHTDIDSFYKELKIIELNPHISLDLYKPILETVLLKNKNKKKVCHNITSKEQICGFSYFNQNKEEPEKPLSTFFTEQIAKNPISQYLTYLFYIYLNHSLSQAKIDNYQYIYKGGTAYRASILELHKLLPQNDDINHFFNKYILNESSPDCIFQVSDFDSIIYLLFSGSPLKYLQQSEYVKEIIISCLIHFKELFIRNKFFKTYYRRMIKNLTDEWKTEEFKTKLLKIVQTLYPKMEIKKEDIWVQLLPHSNQFILKNPNDTNYHTLLETQRLPRVNIASSISPLYVSCNETIQYPTEMDPELFYHFNLYRLKFYIIVHIQKIPIKVSAEFIDVALPLYDDYGLQMFMKHEGYKHLNTVTPFELYRGLPQISFDDDVEDMFQLLLNQTKPEFNSLKVIIYAPIMVFDDLVTTLLQKQYPWEGQKLEKRLRRFLFLKLLYQTILYPNKTFDNNIRSANINQIRIFFQRVNSSNDEMAKYNFLQMLEQIHETLKTDFKHIKFQSTKELQTYFMGS